MTKGRFFCHLPGRSLRDGVEVGDEACKSARTASAREGLESAPWQAKAAARPLAFVPSRLRSPRGPGWGIPARRLVRACHFFRQMHGFRRQARSFCQFFGDMHYLCAASPPIGSPSSSGPSFRLGVLPGQRRAVCEAAILVTIGPSFGHAYGEKIGRTIRSLPSGHAYVEKIGRTVRNLPFGHAYGEKIGSESRRPPPSDARGGKNGSGG